TLCLVVVPAGEQRKRPETHAGVFSASYRSANLLSLTRPRSRVLRSLSSSPHCIISSSMPLPILPTSDPAMAPAPPASALSNISICLDAIILHAWRDDSAFGMSAASPYYGLELQLKKDALYQLKGRFFVDMDMRDSSGSSSASYMHIDDAVRFQGPGVLRSFRTPRFWVMGEVVQIVGGEGEGWGERTWEGRPEVAHARSVAEGHGV
ncbi:hypothetical protein BUE80_DR008220, partial [Diplocarpon rosae]